MFYLFFLYRLRMNLKIDILDILRLRCLKTASKRFPKDENKTLQQLRLAWEKQQARLRRSERLKMARGNVSKKRLNATKREEKEGNKKKEYQR